MDISPLYSLSAQEATRFALRITEDLLENKKFSEFDLILKHINVSLVAGSALLGILALSRFERDQFWHRDDFINRVEKHFLTMMSEKECKILLETRR